MFSDENMNKDSDAESECPKYDCEELPPQHFQVKKYISVTNPGPYFTFKDSTNQGLESMLCDMYFLYVIKIYLKHQGMRPGSTR